MKLVELPALSAHAINCTRPAHRGANLCCAQDGANHDLEWGYSPSGLIGTGPLQKTRFAASATKSELRLRDCGLAGDDLPEKIGSDRNLAGEWTTVSGN
jgi:hypothetical protein